MTEHLSVRMTLLDAQIVDRDRLPIGRVDDLELCFRAYEFRRRRVGTEGVIRTP